MASSKQPAAAGGGCPVCGRPTDPDYRPFCSRRCADVDLSRWLRGAYAIPDDADSEDGDEAGSTGQPTGDDKSGGGER